MKLELMTCLSGLLVCTFLLLVVDATLKEVQLCQASGYCSLSKQPSHYIGPLRSNLELRSALKALAYRKEIIITTENRMDPAAQFIANFQKAGYGHLLLMTETENFCKHLSTVFEKIGCGWSPEPTLYDPVLSAMFPLQYQYPKLWLGARIIRLGYNVMISDTDNFVLSDLYFYVKQPPFAEVQFISNFEPGGLNGAWFYIQNASPSGPVAWAFANALIRYARLVLQPEGLNAIGPQVSFCHEQDGIHDVVYSTIIGRPFFKKCIRSFFNKTLEENWASTWDDLVSKVTSNRDDFHFLSKEVETTSKTRNVVGRDSYSLWHANMLMPHIHGKAARNISSQLWPYHLGGQVYGKSSLPLTIQHLISKFLIEDIDSPLWVDVEDPSTVEAASEQPHEVFAVAPSWLVNTYQNAGRFGQWNTKLTNLSKTVIGHTWVGLVPGYQNKRAFAICTNLYDFRTSARLHGHPSRVYPGSHHAIGHMPPVIAYIPTLFNHKTPEMQFFQAVHNLGKIAMVSRHVIGWPGAPMAANWTHSSRKNSHGYGINKKPFVVPYDYLDFMRFIPFAPKGNLIELSGVWGPMMSFGCVTFGEYVQSLSSLQDNIRSRLPIQTIDLRKHHSNGVPGKGAYHVRGLLPMDLKHYVSTISKKDTLPGVQNTLAIPRSGKKGSDGVTVVSYTHVREEALRMALQPIVYIDRLLRIDALDAVDDALYQDMWKDCCAMQYDAMLNNSHTSACREYRSLEMARF